MFEEATNGEELGDEAASIVDEARHTHYQHPPFVINPQTGTYDVDCSGFVSYVLEIVAPRSYHVIPKEDDQPVPRAFEYYEFLSVLTPSGSDGWSGVYRLADCVRGDIIACASPGAW